jgi:3-oxoacyl-[acyl-carrier-protein] synthase III
MKRPIAQFVGTGRAVPAHVLTNHDFARSGSRRRRVDRRAHRDRAAPHRETARPPCSHGGRSGARSRWSARACTAGELDAIILSTATPDRLLPATAVDLQAALGATRAAAFDLSAACSGWLYG